MVSLDNDGSLDDSDNMIELSRELSRVQRCRYMIFFESLTPATSVKRSAGFHSKGADSGQVCAAHLQPCNSKDAAHSHEFSSLTKVLS